MLFLEQADRPNDYFLYNPEQRRVRRLPESIANDDVYGIDLEFLGFGVAQSEPTEVVGMKRETVDGPPPLSARRARAAREPALRGALDLARRGDLPALKTEQRRGGAVRLTRADRAR